MSGKAIATLGQFPWYDIAIRELGVSEVPGVAGSNPRIEEYHRTTGLGEADDEVPWCSSFINWCVERAGLAGSGSAAARSWLEWGVETPPVPGAIVVLWYTSPDDWRGHVGIIHEVDHDKNTLWVVGGNESDAVRVVEYPMARVLSARLPKKRRDSTTIRAAGVAGGAGTVLGAVNVANEVAEATERTAGSATSMVATMGTIGVTAVLTAAVIVSIWWIYKERVNKIKHTGR